MFPSIKPDQTQAWKNLQAHYEEAKTWHLKDLFKKDSNRFNKYSIRHGDILVDYSKNIITEKTLQLLLQLAAECKVKDAIEAMFNGEKINRSENRPVLHVALRNFSGKPIMADGKDVMPEVKEVLQQMKAFCDRVHSGEHKGYTGKKIKYIVNIGIGGSDLGPYMVTESLTPYFVGELKPYFVSNVDGTHMV